MKKLILILFLFVKTFFVYSQIPQSISYQGVANNANGTPITTPISLRISILDSSATGSEIYKETFTAVETTSQGVYSINIGLGTPVTGTFSIINWGINLKFIKVEMDPTPTGTNYVLVGTSQLMSVPYALYAEKSNSDIKTVNNINDLRAITSYANNQVVLVKGYYSEGDGGDGYFIYKTSEATADTGGIHIKPNAITPATLPGRWIRQYSGHLNAIYFGIVKFPLFGPPQPLAGPVPTGGTNSDRIDAAINYIHANTDDTPNPKSNQTSGDMTFYFPDGTYFIERKITLWSQMQFIGGRGTTFIPNSGFTDPYIFEIGTGPIIRVNLENIIINTGAIPNLGGIHMKGDYLSNPTLGAGAWTGTFKNLFINCSGHGIYLEGGDGTYQLPNQYLIFESVNTVISKQTSIGLKITGELDNCTFLNCQFGQRNFEQAINGIGPECSSCIGISISSSNLIPSTNGVSFINCATGGAYGCRIENASNITFDGGWIEPADIAFNIKGSYGINIKNTRFANAAGTGSLTNSSIPQGSGRCINVENSYVNIENNYVTVSDPNSPLVAGEKFITGIGNNNTINAKNNSFQDVRLSESFGITQYANIGNVNTYYSTNTTIPGINTLGKKIVLISVPLNSVPTGVYPAATTNQIFRINSTIAAGETIFIRADQGSIQFNAMNPVNELTGKNIYLNGRTELTLSNGQGATFIKGDGVNGNEKCGYQLVSIANSIANYEDASWKNITAFTPVISPTLPISSLDANSTVRYRKKNGVVYLDGNIKGGVAQTNGTLYLLFTLPPGYIPTRRMSFPTSRANTSSTSTVGRIEINIDGSVYGVNYSNLSNSLSGIYF